MGAAEVQTSAADAAVAMTTEREMTVRQSFRFWPKAICFSLIISCAIIMEGYDTNLMSNFYPFPPFQNRFGDQVDSKGNKIISAEWQTIINNSGQAGSIVGLILNGWITERIGYRMTMQISMVAMIGAIFIPFFSTGLPMFVAGSVCQSIPWGVFQTLAVSYAADICPLSLRHYMTAWINVCWVIGQLISIGILNGLLSRPDEWAYRIPFALQWIWPIPIMVGTYYAPESPWWLVRHNRLDDARRAIERMITPQPDVEFDIDAHVEMMRVTTEFERENSAGAGYLDCFRGSNLRRTEISCMAWLTQAFAGTPFMGFGVQFMIQAGLSSRHGFTMSLVQTALGFIGCFIAMWVLTRFGRRTIYLVGLGFMVIDLTIIGCLGIPTLTSALSWAVGVLMVVVVVFYQITIGPACFTVVAEMPSTQLRAKTVAFARACYNAGGFITNVLMPRMIGVNAWNWGAKGGFFWAGIAALFFIWSFFRLPEAKGLTYSELDLLFEHRTRTRGFTQEAADLLKPELTHAEYKEGKEV
ncbi:sugar porter family MFS transporter [Fusarium austroafricanum]|uniref:Sugar porter family MFS transporter n=1 Tax=Fusarium austroafricanum TaxID=2364996 RepID=A0A8H4PDB2_9HYPO|nr:sugar porter family MFS transporter [Fusarium austroafricanum]